MKNCNKITHGELSRYFKYDEGSPSCLTWKIDKGTAKAGEPVGALDSKYYRTKFCGKCFLVHRLIFMLHNPELDISNLEIDHIDQNKTNNTISNLRAVTRKINTRNAKKRLNNTSGQNGVYLQRNVVKGKTYECYTATLIGLSGRLITKSFSLVKYGSENALRLATEWRKNKIDQMNANGAGYTSKHGA